jgi:hypothetical protein
MIDSFYRERKYLSFLSDLKEKCILNSQYDAFSEISHRIRLIKSVDNNKLRLKQYHDNCWNWFS